MIDAAGPGLYLATSAFVLIGFHWCRKYWDSRLHPPLPPGPPSLPILGSIFSVDDTAQHWLSFNAWRSIYGDIIYARLLTKPIVVINSEEIAKDLLAGRPQIYSDKPQSTTYEPFASDFNTSLLPYGDRWRLHRRIFHQPFRPAAILAYHAKIRRGAHKMLFGFLQDPINYTSHVQMFPPSFILPIVYGYEPKRKDDHLIYLMRRYLELVIVGVGSAATVVMETFPFLLQLPIWFPGATYKRASVECLKAGHDVKEIPFKYVKEAIVNHTPAQ